MDASFGSRANSNYAWETRYGAYHWDTETGLYHVRNRFLHPKLGTWLSRDPVWYEGGKNLYAYVVGKAVTYVDPDGLGCASELAECLAYSTLALCECAVEKMTIKAAIYCGALGTLAVTKCKKWFECEQAQPGGGGGPTCGRPPVYRNAPPSGPFMGPVIAPPAVPPTRTPPIIRAPYPWEQDPIVIDFPHWPYTKDYPFK